MRILLLSAYDADSHQYWRKGLVDSFPEHDWQVLTLPARYFSWRIRGNSMSWAFGDDADILREDYDLIIATSMTDLSSLRGFVPSLANTPSIVYFHENQFDYPTTHKARTNVEPQILNLYTALAADKVIFNSHYNYQTLITGAERLLRKLPDQVPSNVVDLIAQKSCVIPVPLKALNLDTDIQQQAMKTVSWHKYAAVEPTQKPLLISWAARWEYDKGPAKLLAIISCLEAQNIDYRLAILGQSFRQVPKEFEQIHKQFSHRIDQFGYAESQADYFAWLQHCDIFLSTAEHEFQGLAVLEAVHLGCIPVLPNRLVYPELFEEMFLYKSNSDHSLEAQSAVSLMISIKEQIIEGVDYSRHLPSSSCYSWSGLRGCYKRLIEFVRRSQ